MVLVGLSVYSPSVRSLWLGVQVLFQRPSFPLSVMFLVVGRACVEIGVCSVEILQLYCVYNTTHYNCIVFTTPLLQLHLQHLLIQKPEDGHCR
jgi:hypothetical protein